MRDKAKALNILVPKMIFARMPVLAIGKMKWICYQITSDKKANSSKNLILTYRGFKTKN